MTVPRFLQIHTLHSYTAALLNRDDTGQAKRLMYGDTIRTRISSQCLKRHWRTADNDPHALHRLTGYVDSYRSRELVTEKVIAPLRGRFADDVVDALSQWFQFAVYSGKGDDRPKKRSQESKADNKKSRPTLLFGEPQLYWLEKEFERLATKANGDPDKAFELGESWVGLKKRGESDFQRNMAVLRANTALPGGLAAALFGRMVTSDPAANIDAPLHVAHAFTVHPAESEGDYFTAVDDLKRDEDDSGADTIQETELTCGLFYGYMVIDLPGLVANCAGDRDLASRVVHNLVHLIAEVTPGAKLGSTAPYGRADVMLIEAGDRQPRSLATAYRDAIRHDLGLAVTTLNGQLKAFDNAYETGEARRYMALVETPLESPPNSGLERLSLARLAQWAADGAKDAPDA